MTKQTTRDEFLREFLPALKKYIYSKPSGRYSSSQFRYDFPGRYAISNTRFKTFAAMMNMAVKKLTKKERELYIKICQIRISRKDINIVKRNKPEGDVKRLFVSSVLPDAILDRRFFASVQNFCKREKAELVILPMRGIHHTHKHYSKLVEQMADKFVTEYYVTDNLKILEAQIPPMAAQPCQIAKRLANQYNLIVAHPKQDMISLPTIHKNKPRTVISTGVLTTRKYPKTASGFKGELDAIVGGVILEIETKTNKVFWRFVQSNHDGSFYDIGRHYTPDGGLKRVIPSYLYIGDIHPGFTENYAIRGTIDMARSLKIPEIGGGDWFDAYSISHHHKNNINVKVHKQERYDKLRSLKDELNNLGDELTKWTDLMPHTKIDIIQSNHNEHLNRYLHEQRFFDDAINYRISLELAAAYLDDLDPIKYWIDKNYPNLKNKINWLTRNTIKRVSSKSILVSQHGDRGPNGSKSSNENAEWSFQDCVLGHTHSPSVLRGVFRVGTLALNMEYLSGPSSWQVMNCIIYPNGARQMIWIDEKGRWHL